MDGEPEVARARHLSAQLLDGQGPRWLHVQQVAARAADFSTGFDAGERATVTAAAWLHDVGYAPELAVTGLHAVDGAHYLVQTGWPPTVCALVAFHTGSSFEAAERGIPDALAEFAPPPRLLLDTLTAADLSTGPEGARVDARERIAEILDRYDDEDPVHRAVRRSAPELLAAVDRTQSRLAQARLTGRGGQPT